MADLNIPAPYEPSKPDYLHDQSTKPEPPKAELGDRGKYLFAILFGVACTAALTAMAFEARASWDDHRDWVVPMTIPAYAIGGVAFAYLAIRRELTAILPGFLFAFITLLIIILNIYRGTQVEGSDLGRDILSILAGVGIFLTIVSLVVGMIMVERSRPERPPSESM